MGSSQNTSPCACTSVRKANRALSRYYEQAFLGSSLSLTQFSILRTLVREGATPLSELADILVMERTSLYRTISPLDMNGAVELKEGHNKKIKVAHITPYGKQLIKECEPLWQEAQNSFIETIGKDQWNAAFPILQSIPSLVSELS